jgi:oligoribonuclease
MLQRLVLPALRLGMPGMATKAPLPSALPVRDRLIWVDCEMTGLDVETDTLLEIAVVVTEGDTLETVAATESIIISATEATLAGMNSWCVTQHGASGLTQACRDSKVTVAEAEAMVLRVLEPVTEAGQSPLAGNTVSMDRRFLERYMPRLAAHLHYRTVDVSTVKELAKRWYPQQAERAPRKGGDHRALGDIMDSIAELRYYRTAVFK